MIMSQFKLCKLFVIVAATTFYLNAFIPQCAFAATKDSRTINLISSNSAVKSDKRTAVVPDDDIEMVPIPEKNYELGKFDVTQKEWRDIMGSNPSKFTSCGDTCPVEQVSWADVQEFIQKLNKKTGKNYRLPSETEWEYACYGGLQTNYCGGNLPNLVAWYKDNSNASPHFIGKKQANNYGLYDMSGNVLQWMENKYDHGHDWRALRGGSWGLEADFLRADFRSYSAPTFRSFIVGFRLARSLP
jgi:formylglycine-generating enzyme required for sulfatase activity